MENVKEKFLEVEIVNPYGFIYVTTNMVNGKKYIGQRKFSHGWKGYLGSGILLEKSIKKYGKQNFSREIIVVGYSREELNKLEIEFIKNHDAVKSDDYYNISLGGECGSPMLGKHHSEETKQKMSIDRMGEKHYLYGKKISEESRNNMSIAQKLNKLNKGENHPLAISNIETIIAIKIAIKNQLRNKDIAELFGKNITYISHIKNNNTWRDVVMPIEGSSEENEIIQKYNIPPKEIKVEVKIETINKKRKEMSEETRRKFSEVGKNRKYSDETRLKMSQSSLKMSDETKKKISESKLKKNINEQKPKVNILSQECRNKISNSMMGRDTKFNEAQVSEIREKYSTGKYSYRQLAKEYDCDHTLISRMLNFKGAYTKIK